MTDVFEPLAVCWDSSGTQKRTLFVRKHSQQDTEQAQGTERSSSRGKASLKNAVFVTGLAPQLANEQCLGDLFSRFGAIKSLALHPSQKSCIVVFVESAAVDSILTAAKTEDVIRLDHVPLLQRGLSYWIDRHKKDFPGDAVLQKQADEWMIEFEKKEEEKDTQATNAATEDGWTVVTRKKRKGIALQGHAKKIREEKDELQKTKKVKDYKDLYHSVSLKKQRLEAALSLREQFEQDKKRIAEYRAKREFRS